MTAEELDVRRVPKTQRHPLIFDQFSGLATGGAFVLVNSHDPKHLREEFERDQPGAFSWDYLEAGPKEWRVRIGKRSATSLPRVLCNVDTVERDEVTQDAAGALWKLKMQERHLDANIVRLHGDDRIALHRGPDLDVLLLVVAGDGELITNAGTSALRSGDLVWLPRGSERSFHACAGGLSYLTVHARRPALHIAVPTEH